MFIPDLHPILLVLAAAVALASLHPGLWRRRRRRSLEEFISGGPQSGAETTAAERGGQSTDMPPEFQRRMDARHRANRLAQSGMMIVFGLAVPLGHGLVARMAAIDMLEPALVAVSAALMAAFLVIGIAGIFGRR